MNKQDGVQITVTGGRSPQLQLKELIFEYFDLFNSTYELIDSHATLCTATRDSHLVNLKIDRDVCYYTVSVSGCIILTKKISLYGFHAEVTGTVHSFCRSIFEELEK